LPDYSKITFPETTAIKLEDLVPDAQEDATILFKRFIIYDSSKRISAMEAITHKYFSNEPLPARLKDIPLPDKAKKAGNTSRVSPPTSGVGGKEYQVNKTFGEIFEDLLELKY
jgi:hypothetical protein